MRNRALANSRSKRVIDVVVSVAMLILALPVLALVGARIFIFMGSPVLYQQSRAGLNGRLFEIVKFRTMLNDRDSKGRLLSDEDRLTPLGRMLRKLSIDELPQLWNVLRGEMSLVGPRPLLTQYIGRYTPEQARRHEVLPGITGWAQVNGRNAISWEEKFALDVWYVDHRSLPLDLWIMALTMRSLLVHNDVSDRNHATMPEFMGSGK